MDGVQPVATVWLRGQVVEMDPANPYPEVLLSAFTGGVHCGNDIRVLTSSPGPSSAEKGDGQAHQGQAGEAGGGQQSDRSVHGKLLLPQNLEQS